MSEVIEFDGDARQRRKKPKGAVPDGPSRPRNDGKPVIKIVAGELPRMTDEANALLADESMRIFRRGTSLVRPVSLGGAAETLAFGRRSSDGIDRPEGTVVMQPVDEAALVDALGRKANFIRYDERQDDWVYRDCPPAVAKTLIARRGHGWKMPPLKAVVRSPTFRPDGSILESPGYDPRSHLLFISEFEWPSIPTKPGRAEAEAAIERLASPLRDLPFVTGADRSAVLALILTALVRPILPTAPLFAVSAPTPGSGKSLSVDLASILVTGKTVPVIAGAPNEEELEKRIGAALMAGDPIVSVDNISFPLRSDFLCSVLSQDAVNVRVLGESRQLDLQTSVTFAATGNGLSVAGDMTRRVVLANLDPRCERPEDRVFDWDARAEALANRGALVAAGLTALRAFMVSGAAPPIKMLGGFEQWSRLVAGTLVWCGLDDPLGNASSLRESDPERERTSAVFRALAEHCLNFTAAGIRKMVAANLELADALHEFMHPRTGFDTGSFGRFLRKHKGRKVAGLTLEQVSTAEGVARWKVS